MELKEKIKKEVKMIPEEYLSQIERYIKLIQIGKTKKKASENNTFEKKI